MIVISLVLVVISAVSLLVGGLFRDDLILIWVSIGAALSAALFLALGVLRGTRRRKPTKAATLPGEDATGKPATWQGAGWTGAAGAEEGLAREEEVATFVEGSADRSPSTDATTRLDEAAFAPPRPAATEETRRLDSPTPADPTPSTPAPKPAPPKPPPSAPAGGWAPPAPPKPATPPPPVPPPPGG